MHFLLPALIIVMLCLYTFTCKSIKRRQYIQNSAASVLTSPPQHIAGVQSALASCSLWIFDLKTLTLTYKAVYGMAPSYICDLVKLYVHSHSLQSADSLTLQQ